MRAFLEPVFFLFWLAKARQLVFIALGRTQHEPAPAPEKRKNAFTRTFATCTRVMEY